MQKEVLLFRYFGYRGAPEHQFGFSHHNTNCVHSCWIRVVGSSVIKPIVLSGSHLAATFTLKPSMCGLGGEPSAAFIWWIQPLFLLTVSVSRSQLSPVPAFISVHIMEENQAVVTGQIHHLILGFDCLNLQGKICLTLGFSPIFTQTTLTFISRSQTITKPLPDHIKWHKKGQK